jgi:hypothetical protein
MLFTRFDATRLRAVEPAAEALRTCPRTAALVAACLQGAGPADRPWWQPWARPCIERPFVLLQVDDVAVAHRACLWLDGTWLMRDVGSDLARLAVRLRTKWADAAWWRPLQAADPWDAGVAVEPGCLAGFRPRRATLIVIEGPLDEAGRIALAQLEAQAAGASRAVRVVLMLPAGGPGKCAPA